MQNCFCGLKEFIQSTNGRIFIQRTLALRLLGEGSRVKRGIGRPPSRRSVAAGGGGHFAGHSLLAERSCGSVQRDNKVGFLKTKEIHCLWPAF